MYCSRCGAQLGEGQRYCSHCGTPVGLAVVPAQVATTRLARHVQLLGVLWIVASALNLLGAAVLLLLSLVFSVPSDLPPFARYFVSGLFTFLGVLLLAKALAGFAAGFGLLQRASWARVLALVLGFLSLLNLPLGTLLGIYTIWVLLPQESAEAYGQQARAA